MSKLYNFKSAYPLLESQYGIECNVTDFEDNGLYAWDQIGSKHTRMYRYIGDADEDGVLELPCNVDKIESVTIPVIDAPLTSSTQSFINHDAIYVENYIEKWKGKDSSYYASGHLVEYKEGDGVLYLPAPYKNVCVLYHGVLVDEEEGLPLITEKEQKAIAAFVAYSDLFKEGLKKKDGNIIQLSDRLYQIWLKLCSAARVPEYLSQNDMDRILDVKFRWDRKSFKKSFKPIV